MNNISATEARKQLYSLVDRVQESHEPVWITGKRGNAVLVSENDWRRWRPARLGLDSDGTRYTYLWGPGRIPLSVTAKTATGVSTTYAYHTDALGSVIAMTDTSGTVVASYAYDPWGRVTSTTGTGIAERNPLRYRNYYLDAETDLYYMPARYYDPATYRFLSADPAAPSAGDPGTLNAFAYCLGDPVDLADPSGATIDVLGDGKLGVEDCLQQMATISGDPAR